jgi:hypothetical protein
MLFPLKQSGMRRDIAMFLTFNILHKSGHSQESNTLILDQ